MSLPSVLTPMFTYILIRCFGVSQLDTLSSSGSFLCSWLLITFLLSYSSENAFRTVNNIMKMLQLKCFLSVQQPGHQFVLLQYKGGKKRTSATMEALEFLELSVCYCHLVKELS